MGAYNGDQPYIFVSYSHKDTEFVMRIVNQMIQGGYRVWYDEGIKPGADWVEFIAAKINGSGLFMAFISENYLESGNCRDELNYSRDHVENVLLVYLSNVTLPAGMELRFGRTQAIPAYQYTSKDAFFEKLYHTHGISEFQEPAIEEIPIADMPVIDIPDSSYNRGNQISVPVNPTSAPVAATTASAAATKAPAPVNVTATPDAKAPIRVEHKPKYKFNINVLIAAAAAIVVIALLLLLIFNLPDKSDKEKTNETTNTNELFTPTDESNDDLTTTTSETAPADTTAATTSETTTEATTEETTTEEPIDAPVYSNIFEPYNLSCGESYYNSGYSNFYDSTGAVYLGYNEGDRFNDGTFYATDTMSMRIPTLNDYAEEVSIQWYHIEANGEATFIYGDFSTVPTMVNDEMCYTSTVPSSALPSGYFPSGTYYVAVIVGDGTELTISRVAYMAAAD